ncbi:MAG: hypothetical protein Q9165_002850 [Trypethelium subeluteriae]
MRPSKVTVPLSFIGFSFAQQWVVDQYVPSCACRVLKSVIKSTNDPLAKAWMQNLTLTPRDQSLCDDWDAPLGEYIPELVDASGTPTRNFAESVGVRTRDVDFFCGPGQLRQKFSFSDFSGGIGGLLFPWLILLIQIGRQTGTLHGDILSVLVSAGSPAWICSCVFLGVLYRNAVRKRMHLGRPKTRKPDLDDGPVATASILEIFIHDTAPLHAWSGALWRLIVSPGNMERRERATSIAMSNRSRVELIFVFSSTAAAVMWILAIIADFSNLLDVFGSPNSAEWQICNGIIWLWSFAAAYGSIATKFPSKPGVVADIVFSTGEAPERNDEIHTELHMPTLWNFKVEVQQGGAVNYGHGFFTARYVCRTIMDDLEAMVASSQAPHRAPNFASMAWTPNSSDWVCFVLAHVYGVILQCATIIPAFFAMYKSPPEVCLSTSIYGWR